MHQEILSYFDLLKTKGKQIFVRFIFQLETQIPPVVERSSQHWLWLIGLSITAGVILLIILVGVLWCVSISFSDDAITYVFTYRYAIQK